MDRCFLNLELTALNLFQNNQFACILSERNGRKRYENSVMLFGFITIIIGRSGYECLQIKEKSGVWCLIIWGRLIFCNFYELQSKDLQKKMFPIRFEGLMRSGLPRSQDGRRQKPWKGLSPCRVPDCWVYEKKNCTYHNLEPKCCKIHSDYCLQKRVSTSTENLDSLCFSKGTRVEL